MNNFRIRYDCIYYNDIKECYTLDYELIKLYKESCYYAPFIFYGSKLLLEYNYQPHF